MAYPYQISSNAFETFPFAGRPIVRSSTVLYKHLQDPEVGPDRLEMWKSTDAGVTWAEVDSAGATTVQSSTASLAYADDGTRIWFMFLNGSNAPILKAFNTSTDLWEADIVGGPTSTDITGGTTIMPNAIYMLAVRSNGDKVVFYAIEGPVNCQEIWAKVYDGSWGTAFEVLVQDFSEPGLGTNYAPSGCVIDDDDQTHVFAWTDFGYAYVRVNADDSLSNYIRFQQDNWSGEFIGGRSGIYGEPRIVEMGNLRYAAFPHAYAENIDGDYLLRPGILFVPTDSPIPQYRVDFMPEYLNTHNFSGVSWLSCCVAYDSTTETVWFVIGQDNSTAFDYIFEVLAFATKGGAWSVAQTVYTPPVDSPIETIEIVVENNVLKAFFQSTAGGTFNNPHYWQSTLTNNAPTICTTDFSGQNLSGYNFSGANFTGANLTGATGLPSNCDPVVPVGADPPMPPVYPYVPSSGSVYARENLTANLKMIRGDTFVFKFVVVLNGVVVNITGNDFIMTCRYRPTETVVFTRTSDPADGIVLSDPTVGECTVTIDPEHTDFLNNSVLRFPYDVEMTDGSGNVSTVLYGTLTIYPDITYVDA